LLVDEYRLFTSGYYNNNKGLDPSLVFSALDGRVGELKDGEVKLVFDLTHGDIEDDGIELNKVLWISVLLLSAIVLIAVPLATRKH